MSGPRSSEQNRRPEEEGQLIPKGTHLHAQAIKFSTEGSRYMSTGEVGGGAESEFLALKMGI